MSYLKVHFDGRVLVPEEPVNLPLDESFEVIVPDSMRSHAAREGAPSNQLPHFTVPADAQPLRSQRIREAQDD
ncbi:MAG TPA: hypothetical protein VHQ47_00835 [Phycisphaerae bacterium]|jgi:hypothetical protein|nr:hypothetical protein [Phycisphaerae bacterium]